MLTRESLIFSLYQIGAIQFGEFKLKSGEMTSVYLNLRKIIAYPNLLREIANHLWNVISGCKFDLICGVPYTALPIATCLSLDHQIPMIIRRKEKKEYGTMQLIEGEFNPGQRCLVVEDVITTGSSIIETANDLEKLGLQVIDTIALIDREQGGRQTLEKKYTVHTVLSLSEIMAALLNSTIINSIDRKFLEAME